MSFPTQDGFRDPNAQLLASVVPPPPPTLRDRVAEYVSELRAPSVRSIVRWSRSREARDCCIAAVVGAGLMIAFYRSESFSSASTAKATARADRAPSAPVTERAHIQPAPTVLAARAPSAAAAAAPAMLPTATPAATTLADADADADDSTASSAPESAALDPAAAPKKALSSASKQRRAEKKSKKKLARTKQKAKRVYAARSSSRSASRTARHAKNQRVTTPGPLGAWLATRSRSDEANAAKRR